MADETKVEISIEANKATGAVSVATTEIKDLDKALKGIVDKHHGEALKDDTDRYEKSLRGINPAAKDAADGQGVLSEASGALSDSLVRLASVAAIGAFFKMAVDESLKEAEALRVLQGAIESTGAAWGDYADKIEQFAKTQQAQTRFDDTVTFEVLGKLALATRSVGEAMRATQLAQDLSVKSGKPLAQTTEIISQLLLGQERAVKMATKEFGNYAGGASTAQGVLDNLQKSVLGAAAAEDSATKSFAQLKASIGDTMQLIGDIATPQLVEMATAVGGLLRSTLEYIGAIDKKKVAQAGSVRALEDEVEKLRQAAESQMIYGGRTAEGIGKLDEMRRALREKNEELEKAIALEKKSGADEGRLTAREDPAQAQKIADEKLAIQRKLTDDTNAIINDEFENKRIKMEEEYAAAVQAGVDKLVLLEDGRNQEYTIDAAFDLKRIELAEQKRMALADIDRKELADKVNSDKKQEALDEARKKNFVQTLNFISTLQTSKNKELAAIGKAAAIAATVINTANAVMGAYASLTKVPVIGFALATAAAGLVATAGAAQIATIAGVQLKKGAFIPGSSSGVQATVGEEGRDEAVIPLEDSRAMNRIGSAIANAGGTNGGTTIINLNVTASLDFRDIIEKLADEAANGSPEIIRVARRLGDLNELHGGRAS